MLSPFVKENILRLQDTISFIRSQAKNFGLCDFAGFSRSTTDFPSCCPLGSEGVLLRKAGLTMEQAVTEMKIGGTLYIVTAKCSPSATETVEQKLERIICRHARDAIYYQSQQDKPLAISGEVREYTADTII